MKKIMLALCLICFCVNLYAQEKATGAVPQWPIKPVISAPKFIDSLKFVHAIKKTSVLKEIYLSLKKDTAGFVYQYTFYVDAKGKIIPAKPETIEGFESVNKFVESVFFKYRWKPAYRLGCKNCFVKTYGILSFDFNPDINQIICVISIHYKKEYKVFNQKIVMK